MVENTSLDKALIFGLDFLHMIQYILLNSGYYVF